jgi:CheY-like chemotaxis protein
MNGVIGMLDLLKNSKLDAKQSDQLGMAKQSAESLLNLINDILDFSKIEAGELNVEQVSFDINDLLESTVRPQQITADAKALTMVLIPERVDRHFVVGDPLRLAQILNNLISNAIKFTEAGSITIKYSVIKTLRDLTLKVTVTDTGVGITPAAQVHLFDSFTQADTSTTREFGGTGLGLAISKQLCGLMEGEILVDSTVGEGSTFNFSIKLGIAKNNDSQLMVESAPSEEILAGMQVLLVEDNDINQQVMLAILETLDIDVVVANDGQEALDILSESEAAKFHLILMDCQMPRLDGYEATGRIRDGESGSTWANIPIVALTANAMEGDREKCMAAGMDDYLTKPIDVGDLEHTLIRLLPTEQPRFSSRPNR